MREQIKEGTEEIMATYKDGVLEITVPRPSQPQPKAQKIPLA